MLRLTKNEALDISLPKNTLSQLQSTFVFKWQQKAIKYLGIQIPTSLSTLTDLNYMPLLRTIHTRLETYDKSNISWFGRMNVVKMDILPKFLYIFQAIPVPLCEASSSQ